jgi:inorganic pyrophosphatase
MPTAMFYPCNYGYINNTLSLDNDPVDVMIHTPYPIASGSIIRGRPVGMLEMEDESGEDAKIIAVPHDSVTKDYKHIKNIYDLPSSLLAQIVHFFENYKGLEEEKWVRIRGWQGIEAARSEIMSSFNRAQTKSQN